MSDPVDFGVGPIANPTFSTGFTQLDRALDAVIPGENIMWVLNDTSLAAFVCQHITDAAGANPVIKVRYEDIESQRFQLSGRCVVLVSDFPRTQEISANASNPAAKTLTRLAQSTFHSADSVCHWLVAADDPGLASWSWAMQIVISVFSDAFIVQRSDGRVTPRGRVPTPTGAAAADGVSERSAPRSNSLGDGVRAARTHRGWSQAELARRVGVTASAISQVERGLAGISLDTALEIADQLCTTIEALNRGDASSNIAVQHRIGITRGDSGEDHHLAPLLHRDGLRTHVIESRQTLTPAIGPSESITVLVGSGLVCIERSPQKTLARSGDIAVVVRTRSVSIRNVGDEQATLFTL